jgi:hypothetical protein
MENTSLLAESVNYEEAPLAMLEVDGVEYRVDVGHGSAVAVSHRTPGTWDWSLVTEGRWDGYRLKAKSLKHTVLEALAVVLGNAMREQGSL